MSLPAGTDDYDLIYLGYSIYRGTLPMAVLTFLESFNFTGKTITPFCTNEGTGPEDSINDIKVAAPGAEVWKAIAIHGDSVEYAHRGFGRRLSHNK